MKKFIKKRYSKYICLFIVLSILLLSLIIKPTLTVAFGQEVYLKTNVYDPRDVFRGDYIHLSYDISEIELEKADKDLQDALNDSEFRINDSYVYIILKQKGPYHQVEKVTLKPPNEKLYIKAKWLYLRQDEAQTMVVDYPWDKYYVSENTGTELEKKMTKNESFARIRVLKGYGVLMEIIVD